MTKLAPNLTLAKSPMRRASEVFEESFRRTWRRVPEEAKRSIGDFLATRPGWVYLCYRMDFDGSGDEPWGRCSVSDKVTCFTFLAPFLELISRDIARQSVIAHELAHCCRHGTGEWVKDAHEEELATVALAERWGFPFPTVAEHDEWQDAVEGWRASCRAKYGRELESRWIGKR